MKCTCGGEFGCNCLLSETSAGVEAAIGTSEANGAWDKNSHFPRKELAYTGMQQNHVRDPIYE